MAIWVSTAILVIVLAAIIRTEVRCGRRARTTQLQVDKQINELAKATFDRHRDVFGQDPTGVFPIYNASDVRK